MEHVKRIPLNYDTVPILNDIQDYYFFVAAKNFNAICESLEMAMLLPFYS